MFVALWGILWLLSVAIVYQLGCGFAGPQRGDLARGACLSQEGRGQEDFLSFILLVASWLAFVPGVRVSVSPSRGKKQGWLGHEGLEEKGTQGGGTGWRGPAFSLVECYHCLGC